MAEEVGIVMKLYDQVSPSLKSIAGNTKAFDKNMDDLEESLKAYEKAQDTLTGKLNDLKKAMEASTVKVSDARKEYRKLKDETSKGALDDAIDEQTRLRREMEETRAVIQSNAAAYKNLYKEAGAAAAAESRFSNRAGNGSGILSALGKAGILSMAGDAASQWANAMVGSTLGSSAGSLFSSALSGAASGAALGTFLPGIGTVVGAAIGGGLGLASGGAQELQSRDAAFIEYYNNLYDTQKAANAEGKTAGISTAAQREMDLIAFETILGEQTAGKYLQDLRSMAASTPLEYSDLTTMSRALSTGFKDDPSRMLALMTGIGNAGSAVGVSASEMATMAQALSQMQSSDKADLERLNIWQDRGVDVIGMLASAYGVDKGRIYEMISDSDISGTKAVQIIEDGLGMYEGAMDEMSRTFEGLTSTLNDTMTEIDNAYGEGYNPVRSRGMEAEISAYGGLLGDVMQTMNRISGENAAYLENLGEEYTREALGAVLLGNDTSLFGESDRQQLQELRSQFVEASAKYEATGDHNAALTMESAQDSAQAIAQAAFEASDQYKATQEAEKNTLSALQDNTSALQAATNAYSLSQTRSIGGIVSSWLGLDGKTQNAYESGPRPLPQSTSGSGHAYGLARVPRNGLYYLHQDERVQTAQEARSDRNVRPIQITITGNNFGAGATAEEIAQRLADSIERKLAAGVLS